MASSANHGSTVDPNVFHLIVVSALGYNHLKLRIECDQTLVYSFVKKHTLSFTIHNCESCESHLCNRMSYRMAFTKCFKIYLKLKFQTFPPSLALNYVSGSIGN